MNVETEVSAARTFHSCLWKVAIYNIGWTTPVVLTSSMTRGDSGLYLEEGSYFALLHDRICSLLYAVLIMGRKAFHCMRAQRKMGML
jgi:hypothetical protein